MIKWIIKMLISGVLALITLNFFCMIYYNIPIHSDNPTGATEYTFEKNKFYSRATEGYACGSTNNEGFNNIFDYNTDTSIDILLMGSSHMEAYNISQNLNTSSLLNIYFSDKTNYNIGTSGHNILYCVSNLEDALSTYKPKQYVVIETSTVSFSYDEINSAINNSLPPITSHDSGIIGFLQKFPYLRLMHSQLQNTLNSSEIVEENDKNDNMSDAI